VLSKSGFSMHNSFIASDAGFTKLFAKTYQNLSHTKDTSQGKINTM
jgi:hypothetical protein